MSLTDPYMQYQKNEINSAEPGQLTLMLYNGAVKFNKLAIKSVEEKNIEKANHYIQRVQAIILELMATLKPEFEISKNLMSLYDYINRRLIEANVKKDKQILMEVHELLEELRDTWSQALKIVKSEKKGIRADNESNKETDAIAL
ncbi:flagellar export chaperone FliS [Peptococcaceae bacterium]|jgi:flagellar protein FliS|nr:flagellar export chaperone FliS [Peptococcaceae bacterium]MCL0052742.1 flagellar export chaperone FliS [Peptococcaceae bacterium]MCL0100593.1 flagellar export chaperone FliS [Peptococcaceae bacterium]